jgi:hypothetical protein
MTNPGENASFANGYDAARSEMRARANGILLEIMRLTEQLETLHMRLETLRTSVFDLAFPLSDGAKDVNQDRE